MCCCWFFLFFPLIVVQPQKNLCVSSLRDHRNQKKSCTKSSAKLLCWKESTFQGTCPHKLYPQPLSSLRGKNVKVFFSPFFINISLKPVLRLGVTIQKNCSNKKYFQVMPNIFYILAERSRLFFSGMWVYPPPPLIGYISPRKSSFFYALPKILLKVKTVIKIVQKSRF